MTETVDYAVFYEMLSDLARRGETGTLYLKNDANHLAIISVRDGRIVSLACGPKHGVAAIELVRQTNTGSVRVDQGTVSYHEHELPSTTEVLELLNPFTTGIQAAPASDATSKPTHSRGAAEKAQILCELLTEYIGPVAPLVCEERFSSSTELSEPEDIKAAIEGLSLEIDSGEEASEFARRAHEALHVLTPPQTAAQANDSRQEFTITELLEIKDQLCELLTDYLGPAAPLVCEDSIAAIDNEVSRSGLEKLVEGIAEEIGNDKEAKEFIAAAWNRIATITA